MEREEDEGEEEDGDEEATANPIQWSSSFYFDRSVLLLLLLESPRRAFSSSHRSD